MRLIAAVLSTLLLATAAWATAETRRHHCVNEGRYGCTILPWSGHHAPATAPALDAATREELRQLVREQQP